MHVLVAFGSGPTGEFRKDEAGDAGEVCSRDLRAILNWAADDYDLTENVAEGIRKHPELTSERPDF